MLQILMTTFFVGTGVFALAVIVSMLVDGAPAILQALGLRRANAALPRPRSRVRVLRTRRLSPKLPVPRRAAA